MNLNEKCGIFGVFSSDSQDVSRSVYYGLWTLQHRGQENSGISCSNGRRITSHKGRGLVSHVYSEKDLVRLKGNIAIGHNRYSTFGKTAIDHSQPVCSHQNTLALAHNGNLPEVKKLLKFLTENGVPTTGLNDSELMHKVLEFWYVKGKSIEEAIRLSFPLFTGAFSLVIMTKNKLVAIRDACGIRPLCLGKINHSYVFSSETCALDAIGAEYVRDVAPGEMIVIDKTGMHTELLAQGSEHLDVFEFIYFARPDSQLLGKNVYTVRKNLGIQLAKEVKFKADIIVPVPDSAIPAAAGFSFATKIPLEHALVKNRYIHRTFISPSQKQRQSGVKMKLNVIKNLIAGKTVALVDDSIVRGTTSKTLVEMVRSAGARSVYLLIPSPPVLYPDFYGIDTPKQTDLIASTMSLAKLQKHLGVEGLYYLSYSGMLQAIGVPARSLCTSCFSGNYPLSIGTHAKKIEKVRFV